MPVNRLLIRVILLVFTVLGLSKVKAQEAKPQSFSIKYLAADKIHTPKGDVMRLQVQDGDVAMDYNYNPVARLFVEGKAITAVSISGSKYGELTAADKAVLDTAQIASSISSIIQIGYVRGLPTSIISIYPFRKFQGKWQKLLSFNYTLSSTESARVAGRSIDSIRSQNSVLASGKWMKFPTQKGINKLDYTFIVNACGINASTDPRNIKIYGNGGYVLSEDNGVARPWDLTENAVQFVGEADGKLDPQDFMLMYSTGTTRINADLSTAGQRLNHQINVYADTAYYFITASDTRGKRIVADTLFTGVPTDTLTQYDDLIWREQEQVNFLRSGRRWVGDMFDLTLSQTYTYDVPGLVRGSNINLRSMLITQGKSTIGEQANFSLILNGISKKHSVNPATNNFYGDVANDELNDDVFVEPGIDNLSLNIVYDKNGSSILRGYIDYLEFNVKRTLGIYNGQNNFRSIAASKTSNPQYILSNISNDATVWNVTNPLEPKLVSLTINGSTGSFIEVRNNGVSINEYVGLSGSNFPVPNKALAVTNQNIKGATVPNLLIVCNTRFKAAAEKLATLRRTEGLTVLVATTDEVYNEFGSGKQDVCAIRDCARYFYATGAPGQFRYLLLLGACSYDYKNRMPNNTNLVPIYESPERTFDQIDSYSSDDFFGLLDANEGNWSIYSAQFMDIGVGRIVAENLDEAQAVVDKLYEYKEKKAFGKWRNQISLLGDNGDSDEHMKNNETIWNNLKTVNIKFNPNKIYIGSFNQILGPGGTVSPDCVDALTKAINKGSVIFNYSGHGNEGQWMDEEVVNKESISQWTTSSNYPFFLVGTCSFGRYDDPFEVSGGEALQLTPRGGGIGLLTTTRLVTSYNNTVLVATFTNQAFKLGADKTYPRVGDVMMNTKNKILSASTYGNRNAGLLADPSMRISLPINNVVITSLNNRPYTSTDTLSALEPVVLSGEVRDNYGQLLKNFNGPISITLFDKESSQRTLDGGTSYKVRNNILYNGTAVVSNGQFTANFVVPADISFSIGAGRFSFYAYDTLLNTDANGADDKIQVGGTYQFLTADSTPPIMNIYLDDTTFRNGDVVRPTPNLLVRLKDLSGINLSTSGIGHEMTAVLDNRNTDPIILNNFFTSDAGTYQSGWVNYPMSAITAGNHSLNVTAWDSYNNSITGTIHFTVANTEQIALSNISVWPNPSSGPVKFRFSHNETGKELSVDITIYSSTGQIISTITKRYPEATQDIGGNEELQWTPSADASAIYFYRIAVSSPGLKESVHRGKLIINPK